jgi:hypothetical protein
MGPLTVLLSEAWQRALKAVWYQKWFVHRRLRPEAFGRLVRRHHGHDLRRRGKWEPLA